MYTLEHRSKEKLQLDTADDDTKDLLRKCRDRLEQARWTMLDGRSSQGSLTLSVRSSALHLACRQVHTIRCSYIHRLLTMSPLRVGRRKVSLSSSLFIHCNEQQQLVNSSTLKALWELHSHSSHPLNEFDSCDLVTPKNDRTYENVFRSRFDLVNSFSKIFIVRQKHNFVPNATLWLYWCPTRRDDRREI